MAKRSKLVLAVVCLCAVLRQVQSAGGICDEIDYCYKQFTDAVKGIGHDQETFCYHSDLRIRCLMNRLGACSAEQKPYAQKQISDAKNEHEQQCGSCHAVASVVVVSLGVVISSLGRRWL